MSARADTFRIHAHRTDLRAIAADWHGGQSSPLYAYASTGTIVPGLEREIAGCLASAGDDWAERARLGALLDAVRGVMA